MGPLRAKLITAVRIEENTALHVTQINGAPAALDITLTPGLYHVLPRTDSDPRSLSTMLETVMTAADAGLSVIQWDLDDTTGVMALRSTVAGATDISFAAGTGGDALELQAHLRLDDAGSGLRIRSTTPAVGYRAVAGLFYPKYYLVEDIEGWDDQGTVLVPDTGNPQGISAARRSEAVIGLQSEGFPRDDDEDYGEYHDLVSFLEEIASYRPFRVYRDLEGVSDEYAPGNRKGWQAYMRKKGGRIQRPDPVVPDYYLHNRITIEVWAYNEALIV